MKVIEPRRSNNIATKVMRSQTFILAVTETTRTLVQATLIVIVRASLGKTMKELNDEAGAVTNFNSSHENSQTLRRGQSLNQQQEKLNLSLQ